jgi:hypothetical protein
MVMSATRVPAALVLTLLLANIFVALVACGLIFIDVEVVFVFGSTISTAVDKVIVVDVLGKNHIISVVRSMKLHGIPQVPL